MSRYAPRYGDFGPTLAAEKLPQEGLVVDHETWRRRLVGQGVWRVGRNRQQHRAHSPQAKGRVERRNGLLQDGLVKELRLAGISDLAAANEFLEQKFLPALNQKFTVTAPTPWR